MSTPFSVITAIISFVRKEANQILPTISLSIGSFCLILFGVVLLQSYVKPVHVKSGTITNFGIFKIPTNDNDSTRVLYELRVLESNTDIIPAVRGLRFGFNYVITGEPDAEFVNIRRIIRYPIPGLKRNDQVVLADTFRSSVSLNELNYYGFRFDHDYELVPGSWKFEYFYQDSLLFSKRFNVVVPNPRN